MVSVASFCVKKESVMKAQANDTVKSVLETLCDKGKRARLLR